MTETPELLPCPFCGSSKIKTLDNFDWVSCQDCGASLENVEPSARKLWNTRVPPSTIGVDALPDENLIQQLINATAAYHRGEKTADGNPYGNLHRVRHARAALIARLTSLRVPTLASEKEGGEDEKPDYMLRGGPGRDYPCNLPNVLECAASECQAEQRCARTPRVASLIAKGEGK